jgi:anti-sigma factor RsiW
MSTERQPQTPVSDQELMCWLDGELDETRHAEIGALVAADPELRAKVAGIGLAGELVRERIDGDERADTVADAVMGKLGAEPEDGGKLIHAPFGAKRRLGSFVRSEPANENARSVFVMAALAAAVAVGLFFWSRAGLKELPVGHGGPGRPIVVPATALAWQPGASAAEPKWLSPAPAEPAAEDEESAAAVEVAAVDFGSHSGTVFYVSSGSTESSTTTAVVWVTDEVTGGKR